MRPRLTPGRGYDLAGVVLAGAMGGWIAVSASANGVDPAPQLVLLIVIATAVVAGRLTRSVEWGAGVVAAIVVAVAVLAAPETLHGPPRNTPLDYENADAAWFAQGTAAAVMLALSARSSGVRRLAWAGAVFLVAVSAGLASATGALMGALVLLTGLVADRVRPGRVAVLGAAVVLLTVVATAWLAVTPESAATRVAERGLSERRIEVWRDAIDMTAEAPVLGVGPGRFGPESPTVRRNPDTAQAHSAYLQQAAETGLPGAVLLGGLLAWGYGAMYRSWRDPAIVVVGIAGLTALAVHAAIDYVAHFPPLVVTAAFLLGLGSGGGPPPPHHRSHR